MIQPRKDDWDDLTELLQDLEGYHQGPRHDLYTIVQAVAEGRATSVKVLTARVMDFVEHMREFNIDATPNS